jgi:hypothetical protein
MRHARPRPAAAVACASEYSDEEALRRTFEPCGAQRLSSPTTAVPCCAVASIVHNTRRPTQCLPEG